MANMVIVLFFATDINCYHKFLTFSYKWLKNATWS